MNYLAHYNAFSTVTKFSNIGLTDWITDLGVQYEFLDFSEYLEVKNKKNTLNSWLDFVKPFDDSEYL